MHYVNVVNMVVEPQEADVIDYVGRAGSYEVPTTQPPPPDSYRGIAEDIAAQIADGRLKPGDQLPSYSALADLYRVNVSTVQRALIVLRSRGLIEGRQGRGTYVTASTDGDKSGGTSAGGSSNCAPSVPPDSP